jgi:ABC-type hemin transport system substrate-binding protein
MPTLTVTTPVLPGGVLHIAAPELPVGQLVEVTIRVPEVPQAQQSMGIYDLIKSFGPSTRTPAEWEQLEREFQEERNSWER